MTVKHKTKDISSKEIKEEKRNTGLIVLIVVDIVVIIFFIWLFFFANAWEIIKWLEGFR